ncbi:MAG: DUF4476 domain-containing protein [Flavihumibacter sp.]|nr:DUF4476 domain-containing protein [Flavihumibacter sp.]
MKKIYTKNETKSVVTAIAINHKEHFYGLQTKRSKLLLLVALLMSLSLATWAKPNYQTKLSIATLTTTPIRVTIDGQRYDQGYNSWGNANNSIVIRDLSNGYHTIKVFQQRSNRRFENDRRRNRNDDYTLIYSATVFVKPMYHIDIVINRFGKAFIDEQYINSRDYYDNDDDDNNWNNNRDFDRDNRDRDYRNQRAMDDRDFIMAKNQLQRESFDNTRLLMARQISDNNYLSAQQVKELMQLFSFDDKKLDFAKYAYRRTTDRNNYFIVYDAFAFASNKEELANYIRNFR